MGHCIKCNEISELYNGVCTDCRQKKLADMTDTQIIARLKKEYQWRKSRYSESETGIRKKASNAFNEAHARQVLDDLEICADNRDIDYLSIRRGIYED